MRLSGQSETYEGVDKVAASLRKFGFNCAMAVSRAGTAQTSVVAALSSLRKSFGGSAKNSSKGTKKAAAAKSKITAPTAAELRQAAAKKTLRTLQLGISARGYSYTPLPGSTVSRLV
jgi:hypothetical protein